MKKALASIALRKADRKVKKLQQLEREPGGQGHGWDKKRGRAGVGPQESDVTGLGED